MHPAHWTVTGIGSLGHEDAAQAVRAVCDACPELPFWPQLPRRAAEEGLILQGAHGLGWVRPLDVRGSMWRLVGEEKTARRRLRTAVESLDSQGCGPTATTAAGYMAFLSAHENRSRGCVKGQWIGPGTLAASIVLDTGRPVLEDAALLSLVLDQVFLAVLEQVRALLGIADRVHLWLDEPLLASQAVTSAWPASQREAWYGRLAAACGARVVLGVHTCAPPDWEILLNLGVPLLSFDVWRYATSLETHVEGLRRHLEQGGWLAWGAVPTTSDDRLRAEDVVERVESCVRALQSGTSLDVGTRSFLTPTCGLAGLPPDTGVGRLLLTRSCADRLRRSDTFS